MSPFAKLLIIIPAALRVFGIVLIANAAWYSHLLWWRFASGKMRMRFVFWLLNKYNRVDEIAERLEKL